MSADGTSTLPADLQHVSIATIRVVPGRNPRRHFDATAHQQMVSSVRDQGVIQPVTLRPADDGNGFEMVAGERRLRAAIEVGMEQIPAVIRAYTEAQAVVVAQIENQEREGLSITDEVMSARAAIDVAEGDRAEAARILGWSRKRLDMRMLLVHAEPYVLDAVSASRIKIGHAELISTLAPDAQLTVYDRVIQHDVTVETLRTQLASFTQDLKVARFDTAGCQDCPHNSATQASLFEFHVGAGRCSNKTCWTAKVESYLDVRRRELFAEHNVVFLDRDKKAEGSHTLLLADGPRGVGQEQIDTGCKGCINCGVLVSTVPGREGTVGDVTCFDLTCHTQKAHVYREAQAEEEEQEEDDPAGGQADASGDESEPGMQPAGFTPEASPEPTPGNPVKAPKASTQKPAPAKKVAKKKAKAAAADAPKAVQKHILERIRDLATAPEVSQDVAVNEVVILYALRHLLGQLQGTHPKARAQPLFAMSYEERVNATREAIEEVLGEWEPVVTVAPETGGASIAAQAFRKAHIDISSKAWVTKAFLEAHSKSGVEALLNETEFWRCLDGDTDADKKKTMQKLASGKADVLINAALDGRHDFTHFVPSSVATAFRKLTEGK